jgi:hypothetical protein|tara:strand:+ start:1077 stop:1469 length:393 start_codon:yes stop_codon:yes gene_type:complete
MTNFKKLSILTSLLLSLIGCQVTIPPAQDSSTSNNSTNAKTLTILDAKALKGSEKVSVHAYAYTRGSDMCSRTIALEFASELPYTQTLIALRNRALVTGANALSITGWNEKDNMTTLTAHFFDCHSKRGL